MRTEYLDQRNLERWDLTMHENTRQIQLHLESNVHIRPVNRWGPPKREPSIRNLVQPRSLSVGQLLILHALLKPGCFLPEQPLPSGEIGPFEQSMLQNTLNTTQRLDHIGSVVVQVPKLPVVTLMSPPEGILFQHLVLLEVLSHSPSLIIRQRQTILLE